MSLQLKMKLSDLKAEELALVNERNTIQQPQKNEIINKIISESKQFLTQNGLEVTHHGKIMVGSYKGEEFIKLDFTNFGNVVIGSDGALEVKYGKNQISAALLITKPDHFRHAGSFSAISEHEMLEKQVNYYESDLLPYLRESSKKTLPGTYELVVRKAKSPPETYSSIQDFLKAIIS